MGDIKHHRPVLLMLGVISRYDEALAWSRRRAERQWGPIALESSVMPFDDTDYYERTMGPELQRTFFAFERLVEPAELPDIKRTTNDWEEAYRDECNWPEQRPLNLDPGYLTQAKLVLATTKDRDHRIYLRSGIFAEVTLIFQHEQWRPQDWTYPDYRRADYHQFFDACRTWLRQRYHSAR